MTLNRVWSLPAPPKGDTTEWYPVVRLGRTIPFGYKQDPEDPDILQPIPDELNLLERAKKLLTEYSYREVSEWLTNESGRYLSHVGLQKRIKLEQKRRVRATNAALYAKRAKEAAEKAQKLEQRIGGQRSKVVTSGS